MLKKKKKTSLTHITPGPLPLLKFQKGNANGKTSTHEHGSAIQGGPVHQTTELMTILAKMLARNGHV